jgi:hypothetical protein
VKITKVKGFYAVKNNDPTEAFTVMAFCPYATSTASSLLPAGA